MDQGVSGYLGDCCCDASLIDYSETEFLGQSSGPRTRSDYVEVFLYFDLYELFIRQFDQRLL